MCSFFSFRKDFSLLCLLLLLGCAVSYPVFAGDEDVKVEEPKVAPVPEAEPAPEVPEQDAPDLSEGVEEGPEFDDSVPDVKKKTKKPAWSLDDNTDYSEIMGSVEPSVLGRGVLPPALGFRGYRPNMIAVGYGDRVPGYGAMVEYSWNRLGIGTYFSYRRLPTLNGVAQSQNFAGLYFLYRWLPWAFSPYFLLGAELAAGTQESAGGTAGAGIEVEVYRGWTVLVGYTYHSTAHLGFLGGAVGWSF